MKALARRGFLRLAAAAPAAVGALGLQTKLAAHGVSHLGGSAGLEMVPTATVGGRQIKFTTFTDWWKQFGEKNAAENARDVRSFDPDLLEMRLPLATKTRLQRERNLIAEREKMRRRFNDAISLKGFWEWWP